MTWRERFRRVRVPAAVGLTLVTGACGVAPPPPPVQPPSDLVALVADPDDGTVGRVVVRAQGAEVDLASAGAATRIASGQAPSTPTTLTADEIQRIFGEAFTARPPQPRRFLLYFQQGSDDLTADSQAELPAIVAFVQNRPVPDVSVIGHTDTTGAPAANTALGLQRAVLVANQLVSAGVRPEQIDTTSHGEADLLVPTADNVAEARNRRVEVTVR